MKRRSLFIALALILLSACRPQEPSFNISPRAVMGETAVPTVPAAVQAIPTPIPAILPTSIITIIPTSTIVPATSTAAAKAVSGLFLKSIWKKQGPGKVICPILLYHRVEEAGHPNPYYVTPDEFRQQMQALKDWGYTSIPATLLAEALNFGAKLPERPVVITFDDGDESVYTGAYPVMRELGLAGVIYLVYDYIGKDGYMTVEQIRELAASGWEVGSHTLSHPDLTGSALADYEISQSRRLLEKLIGQPVMTFAFPFGKMNPEMLGTVARNYRAGMGLGSTSTQSRSDLYYLWRRPVSPGISLETFGSYLPWSAPPFGE